MALTSPVKVLNLLWPIWPIWLLMCKSLDALLIFLLTSMLVFSIVDLAHGTQLAAGLPLFCIIRLYGVLAHWTSLFIAVIQFGRSLLFILAVILFSVIYLSGFWILQSHSLLQLFSQYLLLRHLRFTFVGSLISLLLHGRCCLFCIVLLAFASFISLFTSLHLHPVTAPLLDMLQPTFCAAYREVIVTFHGQIFIHLLWCCWIFFLPYKMGSLITSVLSDVVLLCLCYLLLFLTVCMVSMGQLHVIYTPSAVSITFCFLRTIVLLLSQLLSLYFSFYFLITITAAPSLTARPPTPPPGPRRRKRLKIKN